MPRTNLRRQNFIKRLGVRNFGRNFFNNNIKNRRRGRRRFLPRGKKTSIINMVQNKNLLPNRYKTSASTVCTFFTSPDSGIVNSVAFFWFSVDGNSINNPFAPNVTTGFTNIGTGTLATFLQQPAGSTPWTVKLPTGLSNLAGTLRAYENYRVYGSRITVEVINEALTQPWILGVAPYTVEGAGGVEEVYTSMDKLTQGPNSSGPVYIGAGRKNRIIRKYMSTAAAVGVTKRAVQDSPEYAGIAQGSYPDARWMWQIGFQVSNGLVPTLPLCLRVTIKHYFELYQMNEGSQPIVYTE